MNQQVAVIPPYEDGILAAKDEFKKMAPVGLSYSDEEIFAIQMLTKTAFAGGFIQKMVKGGDEIASIFASILQHPNSACFLGSIYFCGLQNSDNPGYHIGGIACFVDRMPQDRFQCVRSHHHHAIGDALLFQQVYRLTAGYLIQIADKHDRIIRNAVQAIKDALALRHLAPPDRRQTRAAR